MKSYSLPDNHNIRKAQHNTYELLEHLILYRVNIATEKKDTFAICLTLMTYLASSELGLIIFVHLATWEPNNLLEKFNMHKSYTNTKKYASTGAEIHLKRLLLLHHLLIGDKIPLAGCS